MELSLVDAGTVPTTAKWLDAGGQTQTRELVLPIAQVAERVFLAADWTRTNLCNGQVVTGSVAPQLLTVSVNLSGEPVAELPLGVAEPWVGQLAWIRLYQDSTGAQVFQWFEPARVLVYGYGTPQEVPALVTEPAPFEIAEPLGAIWGDFDWHAGFESVFTR
jgi:hypothetical protein